jgi:hypothetical protein
MLPNWEAARLMAEERRIELERAARDHRRGRLLRAARAHSAPRPDAPVSRSTEARPCPAPCPEPAHGAAR